MKLWELGVALLVVLLLSVDGFGCAGAAMCPDEHQGWACDETCDTCTCDGLVRPEPDTRGECLPRNP